jgi:intraflagellar transport protein 46
MGQDSSHHNPYASSSKNPSNRHDDEEKNAKSAIGKLESRSSSKSQSVANRPFDEAYEMSQSSSDDSVDTQAERNKQAKQETSSGATAMTKPGAGQTLASMTPNTNASKPFGSPMSQGNTIQALPIQAKSPVGLPMKAMEESSDGEHEESYDNIEGAYNPNDFHRLSVSSEIKELFQYIERYKPHEVELESSMKCFIPDYIPSVGDIDCFLKVGRPLSALA